ncbi:hypothetical protein LOC67_03585 [Stieleria sp. JC731]|uniref:hypothetical protein n=1 Tax=Pirellulaceae TaxID=2691357 RepID=UPI001E5C8D35|nr:hypothetical protein [Stieleria sp. JC731]MCC9599631.1 hypothetical protein [Stieleria sp. JC731]
MEQFSDEQWMMLGTTGIVVILVVSLLAFLVMAGSLKLCFSMIGNRSPSFLACIGWLIAIIFVNMTISSVAGATLGPFGYLASLPVTWFAASYMISMAGECGLLRAFAIWIANGFVSTFGIILVVLGTLVPLGMLGGFSSEGLQAQLKAMEEQMQAAENESGFGQAIELDDTTPVVFEQAIEVPAVNTPAQDRDSNHTEGPAPQAISVPAAQPQIKSSPKRANDGSTLNPFFQ